MAPHKVRINLLSTEKCAFLYSYRQRVMIRPPPLPIDKCVLSLETQITSLDHALIVSFSWIKKVRR